MSEPTRRSIRARIAAWKARRRAVNEALAAADQQCPGTLDRMDRIGRIPEQREPDPLTGDPLYPDEVIAKMRRVEWSPEMLDRLAEDLRDDPNG